MNESLRRSINTALPSGAIHQPTQAFGHFEIGTRGSSSTSAVVARARQFLA
jgi:hypothetical protein